MAIGSTIYKVKLDVSNMNIHHYSNYNLTVAKHPSESEYRMIVRLFAFSILCQHNLDLSNDSSAGGGAEISSKNFSGEFEQWITLGEPDEKRVRQICSKAKNISIFTYHEAVAEEWFKKIEEKLWRFSNLNVIHLRTLEHTKLSDIVERGMNLSCLIDGPEIWLSTEKKRVGLSFEYVKKAKEK